MISAMLALRRRRSGGDAAPRARKVVNEERDGCIVIEWEGGEGHGGTHAPTSTVGPAGAAGIIGLLGHKKQQRNYEDDKMDHKGKLMIGNDNRPHHDGGGRRRLSGGRRRKQQGGGGGIAGGDVDEAVSNELEYLSENGRRRKTYERGGGAHGSGGGTAGQGSSGSFSSSSDASAVGRETILRTSASCSGSSNDDDDDDVANGADDDVSHNGDGGGDGGGSGGWQHCSGGGTTSDRPNVEGGRLRGGEANGDGGEANGDGGGAAAAFDVEVEAAAGDRINYTGRDDIIVDEDDAVDGDRQMYRRMYSAPSLLPTQRQQQQQHQQHDDDMHHDDGDGHVDGHANDDSDHDHHDYHHHHYHHAGGANRRNRRVRRRSSSIPDSVSDTAHHHHRHHHHGPAPPLSIMHSQSAPVGPRASGGGTGGGLMGNRNSTALLRCNEDGNKPKPKPKPAKAYLQSDAVYSCATCRAHLCTHEDLISKCFQGRGGRAYLFQTCVNVAHGPAEDRLLITGLHSVRDISCLFCHTVLGWTYDEAFEVSQKYKEGKFILEKANVFVMHSDGDCDGYSYHGDAAGGWARGWGGGGGPWTNNDKAMGW